MGGNKVLIYSIFNSIDGEVNCFGQGTFSTFLRLAECNLSCRWCDTKYAQSLESGKELSIPTIIKKVKKIGCKKITITGGEPLLQAEELKQLTKSLWHEGFIMSIETNGSLTPNGLYGVSSWIVDYKTPSSGMIHHMMDDSAFLSLGASDFIKFVIVDKADYTFAVDKYKKFVSSNKLKAKVTFSPGAKGIYSPYSPIVNKVIQWVKEDKLFDIMINLQLHRLADINEEK